MSSLARASTLDHHGVVEDLAGQIVFVLTTVSLRWTSDGSLDVRIVVSDLHAKAAVLQQ